ncbi:MAG: aminopeptidase, partial [Acidobacteria bacterium]|nr:aminopeptidase [Acidobacteriota bacterium]
MHDPRFDRLAEVLIRHSCQLKAGEKVLIEAFDVPHEFTETLVRTAAAAGAHPLVTLRSQRVHRRLLQHATPEQLEIVKASEATIMSRVDAYIGVRGADNVSELTDVPPDHIKLYEEKVYKPVHMEIRVPKTRWVVLRWPSPSMAQLSGQSTESFEDFYFQVCTMDYSRMSAAMTPLVELMEKTDRVRITAPGTDLTFSIKDIPAIRCDGHRNIPDGEVF